MSLINIRSIRKLICHECGKYLSVGPVNVDNNSFPICGRCSSNDPCEINVPLTSLAKYVYFPCSNDLYGCTERVTWENALDHENKCNHGRKKDEHACVTYSMDMFDQMRCSKCRCLLNVAPVYGTDRNDMICGRCQPNQFETIVRQTYLESAMKSLEFPCRFLQAGCTGLLSFDRVLEHETTCRHRTVTCPSYPFGHCEWTDSVDGLGKHVRDHHEGLWLKDATIELRLDAETRFNRLVTVDDAPYLVLVKISTAKKKLWIAVKTLGGGGGSSRRTCTFLFQDVDQKHELKLKERQVSDSLTMDLVEAEATEVATDSLVNMLNASTVHCCVQIDRSSVGDFDRDRTVHFRKCTWYARGCRRIGRDEHVVDHETRCSFGDRFAVSSCRWPLCGATFASFALVKAHEETCGYRKSPCNWIGCDKLIVQMHMANHKNNCKHKEPIVVKIKCGVDACLFLHDIFGLQEHVQKEHPKNYVHGADGERTVKVYTRDTVYVKCCGVLVKCVCEFMKTDKYYVMFRSRVFTDHLQPDKSMRILLRVRDTYKTLNCNNKWIKWDDAAESDGNGNVTVAYSIMAAAVDDD